MDRKQKEMKRNKIKKHKKNWNKKRLKTIIKIK